MANRGFPSGVGDDGKLGFPHPSVNGGFPSMYYPNQEMGLPYAPYGPNQETSFNNDQCAMPQAANDPSMYNYDANVYMHYRQQQANMINYANQAAAYHQAQQTRLNNPQQIADSIYMAAHAYQNNYGMQQQQMQQPAQQHHMYNSTPNVMSQPSLSVRTGPLGHVAQPGHSPAGSHHSPAGSTHSLGERPMLSPHVQSNPAVYSYNHTNQHGQPNHLNPSNQINGPSYYNNGHTINNSSAVKTSGELDRRNTLGCVAAISNTAPHQSSKTDKIKFDQKSVNSQTTVNNNKLDRNKTARLNTDPNIKQICNDKTQISTTIANDISYNTDNKDKNKKPSSEECVTKTESMHASLECETTHKTEPELKQLGSNLNEPTLTAGNALLTTDTSKQQGSSITESNVIGSTSANHITESNVIGSTSANCADVINGSLVANTETSQSLSGHKVDTVTVTSSSINDPMQSQTDETIVTSAEQLSDCHSAPVLDSVEKNSSDAEQTKGSKEADTNSYHISTQFSPELKDDHDSSLLAENVSNEELNKTLEHSSTSLSSSSASKKSMSDESRLPPRKRKQQLSEHTAADMNHGLLSMPPKKRGRPSKEMVKLRQASKFDNHCAAERRPSASFSSKEKFMKAKESSTSGYKYKSGFLKKLKDKLHPKIKHNHEKSSIPAAASVISPHLSSTTDNQSTQSISNSKSALDNTAVLITPPKKPKASVAEMQKALMKVVSSSSTETLLAGKRKRGRPPGSKNKKTLMSEYRARSGSNSSVTKTDRLEPAVSVSNLSKTTETRLTVNTHTNSTSSNKLKSPSVSPRFLYTPEVPALTTTGSGWICVFCQQISNYKDMGDLFGGYIVQPGVPLQARVLSHKKSSTDSITKQRSMSTSSDSGNQCEVWFHERCIIWAPGVHMVSGKIYGVYESVQAALNTKCSKCKLRGAILGCNYKGCFNRYHLHCAECEGCQLVEDNFSMLCSKHKNKKLVLL